MNKLTYILLIGLLFFSDINAIKIKKNSLRLSSKKNSISKINVSKEQNALRKTHKSKVTVIDKDETAAVVVDLDSPELKKKIAECERERILEAANYYRINSLNIIYKDPKEYANDMEYAAKKAKEDCTKKIEKEEKERIEKMKKICNCTC